jgi:hypothetical protein
MNVAKTLSVDATNRTLSEPVGAGAQAEIKLSQEAEGFCETNGLEKQLQMAIDLAKKCFPSLGRLSADVEHDPDSDDKWITLVVTLTGIADEILSACNNYSSEWVACVPSSQRYMIRVSLEVD